ncbi:MAG: tetratricopeptide repeat protein [Nevskiaceae bacterium]|nr:MAG: tetratricopeptide repeat protein [Nevskiaceae bacterium]TAM24855.1 MAG: tetratricopeptide repeat protein [Nevskiaceae bacterium]
MNERTSASASEVPRSGSDRAQRWLFADCQLDGLTLELTVRGQQVKLEPKPLEMLMFLLRRPGEVVTKDELHEGLWPGRILTESVLTKCVAKLRQGLGDEDQQIIKTVHGYGYRLLAPVTVEASTHPAPPASGLKPGDHPPLRPLWRLSQTLGAGGYGEVWLAEHQKTHERRVFKFAHDAAGLNALKREITLFRLLQASHGARPDFVRLLDWNLEELPYFIEAEHVEGGSLIQWAERQGGLLALPLEQRIDLAAQLAEALAAAHSAGVLHKDLKPSNVLVAEPAEGQPQIKLGDFGSGRLLDLARLERLEITRLGFTQLPGSAEDDAGTPAYLAPELLLGQQPTVQSDIYALGVILFQLLVGDWRRPLAPGWEQRLDDELLREDVAAAAAGDPTQRLADAGELARRLRHLAPRRRLRAEQRRAQTEAAELRSALDRAQQRRRLLRVALGLLLLGLGFSSWGFWRARAEAQRAETAAAEARAAVQFLAEDVLGATDPFGGGRPKLSIKNLLDEATPRLAQRLADYPATRAEMGLALGRAYEGLGDWKQAQRRLETALAESEAALGAEAPLSLSIAERLAYLAMLQSRYDDSQRLYQRIYQLRRASLGETHIDTLSARDGLAWLEYERGHFAQAANAYEALVGAYRGVDALALTSGQWSLADCYLELNRLTDAESLLRTVIAETSRLQGAEHPRTRWQQISLGDALMSQGRWDEAQRQFDQAYEGLVKTVGDLHPYTLTALHYRGQLLLERGDAVHALPLLRRAYDNRALIHGEDHVWTRYSANRVGEALTRLGLAAQALPLLTQAHADAVRHQGAAHPNVLLLSRTLAETLIALRRLPEAEALLVPALAAAGRSLPPDNLRLAYLHDSLAHLRRQQRRSAEAASEAAAASAIYRRALGSRHPRVLALGSQAFRE